jgi:hypothetical protein
VHYVPGEHDLLDEEAKLYRERYGKGTIGSGWYSFDAKGVHFIGLVNVVDLKPGGLGNLGDEQLEWLEADLQGRSVSTPIVVFAHVPLWSVYPSWGWGTEDSGRALGYLKRFGVNFQSSNQHDLSAEKHIGRTGTATSKPAQDYLHTACAHSQAAFYCHPYRNCTWHL